MASARCAGGSNAIAWSDLASSGAFATRLLYRSSRSVQSSRMFRPSASASLQWGCVGQRTEGVRQIRDERATCRPVQYFGTGEVRLSRTSPRGKRRRHSSSNIDFSWQKARRAGVFTLVSGWDMVQDSSHSGSIGRLSRRRRPIRDLHVCWNVASGGLVNRSRFAVASQFEQLDCGQQLRAVTVKGPVSAIDFKESDQFAFDNSPIFLGSLQDCPAFQRIEVDEDISDISLRCVSRRCHPIKEREPRARAHRSITGPIVHLLPGSICTSAHRQRRIDKTIVVVGG